MTEFVTAILDCLLPGDTDWPAAGQHGLVEQFHHQLAQVEHGTHSLAELLTAIGDDFTTLPFNEQTARLQSAEINLPTAFECCVAAAYGVYYTDPEIRRIIERQTGYPARPPQPSGYAMEPFDESLLDTVRQRTPFWRQETE